MSIKPMLACKPTTLVGLRYPLLASPKLDGIRCLVVNGVAKSRKLIDIPNRYIAALIKKHIDIALDGELMVKGTFQDVTSAVMSEDGEPDFVFNVFDRFDQPDVPFTLRLDGVEAYVKGKSLPWLKVVPHVRIDVAPDLIAYEEEMVQEGYEGVMLRDPTGPYKFGRSTEREGFLTKVKRYTQEEARVVGYEERERNDNPAQTDNLGHTKRSQSKGGKVKLGDLGALVVEHLETKQRFNIGSGFDLAQRKKYWAIRDQLIGRIVTFRYNEQGMKDVPRFPVFVGFRDERDI